MSLIYRMFSLENKFEPCLILLKENETLEKLYSSLKDTSIGKLAFEPFVFKDNNAVSQFRNDHHSISVSMHSQDSAEFLIHFVSCNENPLDVPARMESLFGNQQVHLESLLTSVSPTQLYS